MKKFLIPAIAILTGIIVRAGKKPVKIKKTKMPKDPVGKDGSVIKGTGPEEMTFSCSTLLFENGKGKVHKSPVDNMRFLAPDFHSAMPQFVTHFRSNMPVQKMGPLRLLESQPVTLAQLSPEK